MSDQLTPLVTRWNRDDERESAWRADAIALYRKAGFAETVSWEDREQLICMIRDV